MDRIIVITGGTKGIGHATAKKFVQEKLLEKVPSRELKQAISEVLFERDYTMIEETIEAYRRTH